MAIMEKLIVAEFSPEAAIPPHLQIPRIENLIDRFLPEIFNWGLYAPESILKNMIRATNYNAFQKNLKDPESIGGIAGFLRDNYAYSYDPESFVPISEMRAHMADVQERSGDDYLKVTGRGAASNNSLGKEVADCIKDHFGCDVEYIRYSRRDRPDRPMGLRNIVRLPMDKNIRQEYEMRFEYQFRKTLISLEDPFYSMHAVQWLDRGKTFDEKVMEVQELIRDERLNKDLKSTSMQLPSNTTLQDGDVNDMFEGVAPQGNYQVTPPEQSSDIEVANTVQNHSLNDSDCEAPASTVSTLNVRTPPLKPKVTKTILKDTKSVPSKAKRPSKNAPVETVVKQDVIDSTASGPISTSGKPLDL